MKKSWQVFWHFLFWISMISFFVFFVHNNTKMSMPRLLVIFVLYGIINIGFFYLNLYVLIPRYLDKKRFKLYALVLLIAVVIVGIDKYGLALLFKPYILVREKGQVLTFGQYFVSSFFTSLVFIFLSIALKFATDWFNNERVQRDLENQRLSAELSFLKSQINPHFLFNSLNTIYSLAYQKSETTPEAVLKLSEIMRYMLYECNDNKVDLGKELQYVQNYIDLQKIRFGNKAYVNYTINGVVTNQQIVPLLLIAFVENAFKHGLANDAANPIDIVIAVSDHHLSFYLRNKKHSHNRDAAGGIGLSNVQRRLDLLYPGKYKLEIHDKPETYSCELSLDL
ncbi:histidine kinase [Mucilaginibacter sp. RS28]|uniref:Histidine kinase n=1 Tax=Mucilaginibacter straminoryzae TaxID=2932774 RepID=A0A9X1X4F9_9SPHI|nr:histidine kinase [Mucilaginibacter straminoryzae]MCJ8210788.1 histidine kinase [Mucilaginibacter straminoryzae]